MANTEYDYIIIGSGIAGLNTALLAREHGSVLIITKGKIDDCSATNESLFTSSGTVSCPCSTMYRIHPAYLLWVLESLISGVVVNEITVPDDVKSDSLVALQRMLELR